jgi:APA family basic amino acid/polyamine antiporter
MTLEARTGPVRPATRLLKRSRDTIVAALAFAYSLWAIWGSGQEWLAKRFMLLLLGIPVFVWMTRRREGIHEPRRTTPVRASTRRARVQRPHDDVPTAPIGTGSH